MRVWSLHPHAVFLIVADMGITTNRLDSDSVAVDVTLRPLDSRSVYSRSSYSYGFGRQRRGPWLCYHGFERFIRNAFNYGATRIKSMVGDWRSLEEFEAALPALEVKNAGSIAYPILMGVECPCDCKGNRDPED